MAERTSRALRFRDMNPDELVQEEKELRDAIWKLGLQKSTGQSQDPGKVSAVKRDLARLLTVRRERELARERSQRA